MQILQIIATIANYCKLLQILKIIVTIANYCKYCKLLQLLQIIAIIANYCNSCKLLQLLQIIAIIANYCKLLQLLDNSSCVIDGITLPTISLLHNGAGKPKTKTLKLCVLFYCTVCIAVRTLDAGLLARSQYPEGPATGHLDTGFSWFPCVYKRMLRWFPSFQLATTCFSCSPPDLNFLVTYLIFVCM